MPWEQNDPHAWPEQVLEFLSVPLRLAGLVELLAAQRDNTLTLLMQCARCYKERAAQELYPGKGYLTPSRPKRQAIAQRAIEMAIEDSKAGRRMP